MLSWVAYFSLVYIVEIGLRLHCEGWADFWFVCRQVVQSAVCRAWPNPVCLCAGRSSALSGSTTKWARSRMERRRCGTTL